VVAFLILQELAPTRRHPWRSILEEAGLIVRGESHHQGGTLVVLVAERPEALPPRARQVEPLEAALPRGVGGVLLRLAAWWALPVPVRPGLYSHGSPEAHAPVLLTGNFLGSVEAVRHGLGARDCYVVVEDTSGWNVWCASDAGLFTAERAAALMQLSGLERLVADRRVIIPGLGSRIRSHLAELTGWEVITGPLAAQDLPEFLEEPKLTPPMRSLDRTYRLRERLRVGALTAVQLPLWLLPLRLLPSPVRGPVSRFALAASWVLPLLHYRLPGRTGIVKGGVLSLGVGAAMLAANPNRVASAVAVAASGPFVGWIYQSTSPVVFWKRIWR
jgi:CO dehydrogenase/acetyl-CoA synthase delta subunit